MLTSVQFHKTEISWTAMLVLSFGICINRMCLVDMPRASAVLCIVIDGDKRKAPNEHQATTY